MATLKEFVGKLPTNGLSVFDHFVKLDLKGLSATIDTSMFCLIRLTDEAGRRTFQVDE